MAIRKASRKYNSDYMSRYCDDQLEQLEERLTALYANATNDVLSDYKKWMDRYEDKYIEMTGKLEAGEITESEFKDWVNRRMVEDKLFTETVNSMTDILVNTDLVAMALVNDELPLIIAESYNFVQSLGFAAADEAGLSVGTFQVYNARTVQALIKDNPDILKYVNKKEDYKWNKDRLNKEITHSILSGDSIQKTALRIQNVTSMDENAAIRTARTGMTAAENLGRNEGYHDIKEKGVPCRFQWSATHDNRTRDTHILLDGTYQDDDGLFGVGIIDTPIEYPGDPAGDPEEIYNCRCRASLRLEGVDHSQDGDLYEKFMQENYPEDWSKVKEQKEAKEQAFKENKARLEATETSTPEVAKTVVEPIKAEETPIETIKEVKEAEKMPSIDDLKPADHTYSAGTGVVQGENIIETWHRREDQFEFAINDAMNAQGFDGLPRVVSEEEFNKAVEESSFIAQRTYSAPDQETLDSYRDQLYHGDWYVDCSTGGAQYGQGMYCAADYTGTLSDGIRAEINHYVSLNNQRAQENALEEVYATMQRSDVQLKYKTTDEQFYAYLHYLQTNPIMPSYYKLDEEDKKVFDTLGIKQKDDLRRVITGRARELTSDVRAYSYTETLTIAPDARVLTIHEQEDAINYLADEYAMQRLTDEKQIETLKEFMEIQHEIDFEKHNIEEIESLYDERDKVTDSREWEEIRKYRDEFYGKYAGADAGVVATLMGYDAINAEGHGESGSYTVILNRTKVIFKEDT